MLAGEILQEDRSSRSAACIYNLGLEGGWQDRHSRAGIPLQKARTQILQGAVFAFSLAKAATSLKDAQHGYLCILCILDNAPHMSTHTATSKSVE